MAALARSEHERAARSLPAAALPQRAFSENTTKRDIPTFVRARIRDFEAVLPRPFYLWSVRNASRWRHRLGDTARPRVSTVSARSFAGGARVRRHSGRREVVACVKIKSLRRVRAESSRRPSRHRRDASSIAWRCRSPDSLADFHTGHHIRCASRTPTRTGTSTASTCRATRRYVRRRLFSLGSRRWRGSGAEMRSTTTRATESQQQHRRRRPGAGWAKGTTSRSRSTARGAGARPRTSPTSSSGSTTRCAWRGWSRRATR